MENLQIKAGNIHRRRQKNAHINMLLTQRFGLFWSGEFYEMQANIGIAYPKDAQNLRQDFIGRRGKETN